MEITYKKRCIIGGEGMLTHNEAGMSDHSGKPVFIHSFEQIGADYSWEESARALGTTVKYLRRVAKLSSEEQKVIFSALRRKKCIADKCSRKTD